MANPSDRVHGNGSGSNGVELHSRSGEPAGGVGRDDDKDVQFLPSDPGEQRRAPRAQPKPKDKRGKRDIVYDLVRGALKRRVQPPDDPKVEEEAPDFWTLMTRDEYKEGKTRTLPDIKITRVSGGYLVTILEHDTLQSLTFPLDRLDNLAVAAEKALHSGMYPWQAAKSFKNKQGLKKLKDKLQ